MYSCVSSPYYPVLYFNYSITIIILKRSQFTRASIRTMHFMLLLICQVLRACKDHGMHFCHDADKTSPLNLNLFNGSGHLSMSLSFYISMVCFNTRLNTHSILQDILGLGIDLFSSQYLSIYYDYVYVRKQAIIIWKEKFFRFTHWHVSNCIGV